eukprot:163991_1
MRRLVPVPIKRNSKFLWRYRFINCVIFIVALFIMMAAIMMTNIPQQMFLHNEIYPIFYSSLSDTITRNCSLIHNIIKLKQEHAHPKQFNEKYKILFSGHYASWVGNNNLGDDILFAVFI